MWPDEVEIFQERVDGDGVTRTIGQRSTSCRITDQSGEITGPNGDMFVAKFRIFLPPGVVVGQSDVVSIKRKRGRMVSSHGPFSHMPIRMIHEHGITSLRYMSVVC